MGNIDLRPREYVLKNEFNLSRVIGITVLTLVILGMVVGGEFLDLLIQEETIKTLELQEEYQGLEMSIQQVQEDQDIIQALEERREQFEMYIQVDNNWYSFLELIFNVGGRHITIQEFQKDKNGQVTFTAAAEDLRELIRFLSELRKSEMINIYSYEQVGEMEGRYHFYFEGNIIWIGSELSEGDKGEAF